jgi:hypothetical protein
MGAGLRSFITSDCRALGPFGTKGNVMVPVQSVENELRTCAVELRQLAYTLQDGIGEHDLLLMSERMRAVADDILRGRV